MKFASRSRRLLGLVLLALCFRLVGPGAAPRALAQAASAAPSGAIVRQIEVQYVGRATVTRERILANMRTSVGQPFNQTAVEDDIRNLYGTGEVSNVRIFSEPAAGGVKVIVIVATKSIIKEVIFEGNKHVGSRRLQREVKAKKGGTLDEESVEEDRQKLLDYYHDKGYNDVTVKANIALDEANNSGTVSFTVVEGDRGNLESVRFEGNHVIKSRDLRGAMKDTKGKTIIAFIDKSGRLDQNKLKDDLNNVRDLYQSKGYIDVDIPETRLERLSNGNLNLVVVIREGTQYRVGSLKFEGTQVFTDAEIRRFLKMKEGAVYSPKGLKDDKKTIDDYYGSRGYVEEHVIPEGTPSGPGRVDLRYKIEEGGQSFVERVNIEGNTVTKDKVIRREIPVAPGDVFNTVLIEAAKKRLENLGYFEEHGGVETNTTDTPIADRKDLDVLVKEKRTGSLSFGAGFSSIDSLVGQVELTQANFDITNIHGFTGGGQRFRLLLEYGVTRKDFVLSLTEPYFLDTRLALSGEAFYHDTNYLSNDYNQQNLGFDVSVRRPLGRFLSGSLEYRFESIDISDVQTNSSILENEVGTITRSARTARGTLSYDTRDSNFLTRSGTRVDFSPFVAGSILGGTTKDFGFDLTASHYWSLPLDTILLVNGEAATVDTYDGGDRVPISDRLYLGGPSNLRGFAFRKVGPLDYKGNPVGGRTLARVTAEYTYPILARVRGAFFYDAGYVNQDAFDFGIHDLHERSDFRFDPNKTDTDPKTPRPNPTANDLKYVEFGGGLNMDIGLGVRLDLPIGPVRFDYGYPLESNDFNTRHSGKFNFNVGYQF